MAELPNPHDAFFRETLSDVEAARDFVAHYLPAPVVACFSLESLQVSKDSFVDEELRSHYSDLVYEVALKRGGHAGVYLLFEHKSHPAPQVALDLLRYQTRLWRLWQSQGRGVPLAPIVAVVFFYGPEHWKVSVEFGDPVAAPPELRPYVPQFRYVLGMPGREQLLNFAASPSSRSTLNRLLREGKIAKEQYAGLKGNMVEDLSDIEIVNVVPTVVGCAVRLLEDNSLRALDALHLGCAIEARADVFASAD